MATTPQDWRVTAYQEAQRATAAYRDAHDADSAPDAPILSAAEILAFYWTAHSAAAAAAGALVEAELRAGMSWREVAAALGFPDEAEARAALDSLRSAGAHRLHQRLPDA